MINKILTANDLLSGGVVFATPAGEWSPFISRAHISADIHTEQKLAAIGEKAVARQTVVDPFFIDITEEKGLPVPVRYREYLRVNGPSVNAEFSKPSFQEAA